MPTYTYECTQCKHEDEHIHSMTDATPRTCSKCGQAAKKVISWGQKCHINIATGKVAIGDLYGNIGGESVDAKRKREWAPKKHREF